MASFHSMKLNSLFTKHTYEGQFLDHKTFKVYPYFVYQNKWIGNKQKEI